MNVVTHPTTHTAPLDEARALFENRRRDMLAAWRQMILAGATRREAAQEALSTASAMVQIADVECAR